MSIGPMGDLPFASGNKTSRSGKIMKGLAIIFVALSWLNVPAQPKTTYYFQLSGKVADTSGFPLPNATIQFTTRTDTLTTLSRVDGSFVFPHAPSGKFKLDVTMTGYFSFSRVFSQPEGNSVLKLQPITLRADFGELDPVIVARVRPIYIQDDTVNYNVAAFPVRDGSEVQNILKRLPGVQVDINGMVVIQGKPLTKVLVNGKEFFGSDVLLAIQNLPANIVEKIQVIDDYGDKARLTGVRSGDAVKVLNIVLRPDKRNGQFGRAEAGTGSQDKYLADIFGNAFEEERQFSTQAGISNNNVLGSDKTENGGVNYADQWTAKLGGAIHVDLGSQQPHSADSSSQQSEYPGETLVQTQNAHSTTYNRNKTLEMRLTFKPDVHSTLRLTASGALRHSTNLDSAHFTTLQLDSDYTKKSDGRSLNYGQSANETFHAGLYFEKLSPNSRRRFSVDGGLEGNDNNGVDNNQSSATIITNSISTPSFLEYLTTNSGHVWDMHLNSNFFTPLGRSSFLELGYRVQSTRSATIVVTQQPDSASGQLVIVDSLSPYFVFHSLIQNIHAGYTAKLSRLDLTAGIDVEPGLLKGSFDDKGDMFLYSYLSILPNLQAAWRLDKSRSLSFFYSSQPNLPSPQQLAPFTNLSNPQYPVTGNSNLKPSYTNSGTFHFEESSLQPTQYFGFGMGLSYSITQRTIIQDQTTPKDSSQVVEAITWLNAGTTDNLSVDYHVTAPAIIDKQFRININGSASRNHAITMVNNLEFTTQAWTWNQSIQLQLLVPNLIEADLSGNYILTRTLYPAIGNSPNTIRSATMTYTSRHYIFRDWTLEGRFSQAFTSNERRLQPAPFNLSGSIRRQFLVHNKATIALSAFNLLDHSAVPTESVVSATTTYYRPYLTGRYFLLTFQLKLQRFKGLSAPLANHK